MKTSNTPYLPAFILLALCSAALAAPTAYDGFDYGATPGDLTGKNGGAGWSGAYTDIGNSTVYSATGLTYGTLETNGGSSNANDGSGATTVNFRGFGTTYGDDETETWISFLAQRNGATATNKFAGLSFYSGATAKVTIANTTVGNIRWRIFDNNNSQSAIVSGTIAPDSTYLLVVRIVWGAGAGGTDAVSLFVNPTLGSNPLTADASKDVAVGDFDNVRIAGQNAVNFSYDEIRLADSFADVAPEESTTPFQLAITPNGANYDFSWPSQSGKVYDLVSSTDLATAPPTWDVYDPDGPGGAAPYGDIVATSPTNILSAVPPSMSTRFFALVEKDAPADFSVTVENFGVSGQNTNDAISGSLASVLATNPDHLVLYYGINDALNSSKLVALETYRTNLTSMVNRALAASVDTVFLVAIHPTNMEYIAERHPTHPEILRLQDHLTDYNTVVSEVATATSATFIDWRATFLSESPGTTIDDAVADNVASLLRCELNSGDRDGVHLTVAGNQFLGVKVAQSLSSVVASGDVIACMGDSITFGIHMTGAGTATGDTYPAVLTNELN